jgi:long-chain acyl-CoA synthetase
MKLPSFLAARAKEHPDNTALVCGTNRLSFRDLHEQSDRLATAMRNAGIEAGDRVAICLPNCCEFVTIFMAIVKCGALAMPINMRLSAAEIALIFQDAGPAGVFYGKNERPVVAKLLDGTATRRFALDGMVEANETSYEALLDTKAMPIAVPSESDGCAIFYTSGTTGQPKGAITTQANYVVANGFLNAMHWSMTSDDRILVTTSLAHRAAFGRIGNVIVLGCTLYMLPKFDAELAADTIEEDEITVLSIVPTVGRMMLSEIEAAPSRFSSLRILAATGEAFPVEIKRRILAAIPRLGIFSFFAMTEAGSLAMLKPHEQLEYGASVGRVTPGVELRLVDSQGKTVETGEAGEIWARTGQPGQYLVFMSYFNRPDATRDAFEDGWFKTGDIGRFDEKGFLYIVDRKKDMVLSGGYNIYSKEVELALHKHAGVAEAAVIGVPDDTWGEAVAAFVEKNNGVSLSEEELIRWCSVELASYKKPKHIIFIDELPKNSTGKVRKDELRKLFKARSATDGAM